jgi:trk system potassium uptake protein
MATNHHTDRQHIIIIGCGRLGVELALSLAHKKHSVCVVDSNQRAFDRLGPDFVGRTVQGEAVDQDVLLRAGIEETHAFAAVTSSDSVNIVTARVARDIYKVDHVIARIYNPSKAVIYEKLGLQTVATTTWGAQRFEQLILHTGFRSLGSVGNGDVQIYELTVPDLWQGKKLSDLLPAEQVSAGALTRGGKSLLPKEDLVLKEHDILLVNATSQGASVLRQRLNANGGNAS